MPTTNPVPSNDPTDLLFNAQKLDQVVNGSAQSYTDRLGVSRRTMAGIDAAADVVLSGLGYAPPVAYAAGIALTLTTQTVEYAGDVYAPKVANLPFTTSGTFETAKFRIIHGVASVDLASGGGAAMVGYLPAGTGAVATTVQSKLRESVSVKNFGAVGNSNGTSGNGNDDTAAIQAALDYVGSTGGGTVKLPKTNGKYRITSGLRIPSYVTLEGIAPETYPYNGSENSSSLLADFSNVNQWVIDAASTLNGVPVPYNTIVSTTDTYTYAFNCCVKNLRIEAVNTIPFGGIRMAACPGSMVQDVSIVGTGAGLLLNQTYGGNYRVFCLTYYYGVVAWEDCNANSIDTYSAQYNPHTAVVPAGYLLGFMSAFSSNLVIDYKLSTNDHYNRTWAMIIGGNPSVSSANRVKLIGEQFSGGVFQWQAYGTVFESLYVESNVNRMKFAIVGAVCRFVVNQLHAYMSGTGKVFDLGITVYARITAIGFIDYIQYGYGPYNDFTSLVTIDGISAEDFGPAIPQFNLVYTSGGTAWTNPTYQNGWAANAGSPPAYRLNSRTGNVELRGVAVGGSVEAAAFTLPAGFRPSFTRRFSASTGTEFLVLATGEVIPTAPSTSACCFDGFTFYAEL